MTLKFVHRHDIDIVKYDTCIEGAINSSIYATSWYLDIVSRKFWDCLVLGDYYAVMPLPYQKKFFLKLIIQPPFCQQLGVFYRERILSETFDLFFAYLSKHRVRSYCFNVDNTKYFHPKGMLRTNNIIALDNSFDKLFAAFRNDKKRIFRNTHDLAIREETNIDEYLQIVSKNYENTIQKIHLSIMGSLFRAALNKKNAIMLGAYWQDIPICFRILVLSVNRIILLSSGRLKSMPALDGDSYLLGNIIFKNAGTQSLVLDFEGSDIPGVQIFNETFGATKEYYTEYRNFFWIERWKKIRKLRLRHQIFNHQ